MRFLFSKKCLAGLGVLMLMFGLAWWQKDPLVAWYSTKQLAQANEESRDRWLECVAKLESAAVPRLLDYLQDSDAGACENAGAALALIVERWGVHNPRSLELLERLASTFDSLSPCGRQSALQVPIALLHESAPQPAPAGITLAVGTLLTKSAPDATLRLRTLALAGSFAERVAPGQWLPLCHDLGVQGLADENPHNRVQAIRLVLHTARKSEMKLLEKARPLLRDPVPQVRRAALVALGPIKEVLADDDLLPFLHDADVEVRRLAELALRSRGLSESHILLAGLISAPHPASRLEVLHHLEDAEELDIVVWLDRLSRDPSPAVRAAALRACVSQNRADLRPRLRQIAEQDPSPTVRQLARYYAQMPVANNKDR